MLQWHPTTEEEIPTPNIEEIMVFSTFFQRGLGLLACDFLWWILYHYKIELVHLNPNSILKIAVIVHLYEAFLGISPNYPLFKNYFFLKYQPSTSNRKVIGGVGLQTHPCPSFLDLPLKSCLWGWHGHGSIADDFLNSMGPGVKSRLHLKPLRWQLWSRRLIFWRIKVWPVCVWPPIGWAVESSHWRNKFTWVGNTVDPKTRLEKLKKK
jgi:hypothetical protein